MKSKKREVFVEVDNLVDIDLLSLNIGSVVQLFIATEDKSYVVMVNSISKAGVVVEEVNNTDIEEGEYYLFSIPIRDFLDTKPCIFSVDAEGVYYFENAPSISLYFNDEGNVVLENSENTIVFPPYLDDLECALKLLCSTTEDINFDDLFKHEQSDKKLGLSDSLREELKNVLKEIIVHLLNSISRKYEKGFTEEEVNNIRTVLEKMGVGIKKFDDVLGVVTVSKVDGETIYFPDDIVKALTYALEKRGLKK